MELKVGAIHTDAEYQELLSSVNEVMNGDPSPDSDEGQWLHRLTMLIEGYEEKMGWELPNKS